MRKFAGRVFFCILVTSTCSLVTSLYSPIYSLYLAASKISNKDLILTFLVHASSAVEQAQRVVVNTYETRTCWHIIRLRYHDITNSHGSGKSRYLGRK